MAEIIKSEQQTCANGKNRKTRKHSLGIDMTPMVDLMCLLITFFMLTTAFTKPKILEITMPVDGIGGPVFNDKRVVKILLTENDQIYWYQGKTDPANPLLAKLIKTSFGKDGIRKLLLKKNETTFRKIEGLKSKILKGELIIADSSLNKMIKKIKKEDPNFPVILIKADEKAKYRNIVDIIDEMAICNIANYAVIPISDIENKMLEEVVK